LGDHLELEQQARLADPRLRHRGDDLAMTGLGLLGRRLHRLHLAAAPHEFREPPPRRALKPGAQGSETCHFMNIHRLADAFDLGCAQRLEDEVAFAQLAGRYWSGTQTSRPPLAQLSRSVTPDEVFGSDNR